MKKFHYLAFLIVIVNTLTACKEDPPVPFCTEFPDECAEITGVKDYFYFKEGTWWVYEEETSGERDSVYVTSSWADDTYDFDVHHYNNTDGYTYRYWAASALIDKGLVRKDEKSVLVKIAKFKAGDFVSESYCFIYHPTIGFKVSSDGGQPYGYDNDLKVEDFLADYDLNETFSNVVVMTEEHTASDNKQPTLKHYAENIGLIRKELLDSNEVWNLVEYNIVK